jgi:hypothetical protein
MQRFVFTALAAATALSLSIPPAQAQSASSPTATASATPSPGTGGPGGGPGGRRRGGANSPERHAREILAKYDKDGDHALNATELAAFFAAMRERAEGRREQPGTTSASTGGATPAPKANGGLGGHGTPEQHAASAIAKFDKNGDGKLDAGELTAMLIALRERAMERRGAAPGQKSQTPASNQAQGQIHAAPATTIPTNPGS